MGYGYALSLGVALLQGHGTTVRLANGSTVNVREGLIDIHWVHGVHHAHVLMYPAGPKTKDVLLGTKLMHPDTLEIIFLNNTVEIR